MPRVPGAPVYPRRTCMPTLLSGEDNYHHPGSLAGCRLIPALALSPPWPAEPAAAWHPGDLAPLAHHHLPRKEQGLARVNEGGHRPGGCLHLLRRLLLPLCHFCTQDGARHCVLHGQCHHSAAPIPSKLASLQKAPLGVRPVRWRGELRLLKPGGTQGQEAATS